MGHADTCYQFSFEGIDGRPLSLVEFRGRPILVVNTASRCGFTRQYAGLMRLWRDYGERGLVILGVPSNDFGGQEPEPEAAIRRFCAETFGVEFPLAAKTAVRGALAHPFYRWARARFGPLGAPRWNFHKYLIDREGRLAAWFSTVTSPAAPRVRRAIERVLAP
jgi:glutathione peroxidase